jgi:flagellar hook-associated protein 2
MSNGGINVAALGLGGIDTSSIVTQLVAIQQQPFNQLTTQQQNIQSAQTTISSFSSTMSALKNAAAALSTPSGFNSSSATSNSPSVVSTANVGATPGQWMVSVTALAQQQRTLSSGTDSSTTGLGLSGTLSIQVGTGSPTSITISQSDSLSDIAGEIASAGLRVQASMVFDGSQYHLLVAGLDTGKSNGITFDESNLSSNSGFSLGLSDPANNLQAAQDAQLTVGGTVNSSGVVTGGIAITSATNQVTNAIPGVTLALTQTTTAPATVTIGSDPSSVQANVQAFVTAYNAVIASGHATAGFGTTKASNTLLQGDSAVRTSLDQLESLVGGAVPGTTGAYTTLDSVGIGLNTDGTLTLDTTKLASAVSADPTSVERLFVTDTSNGSQGIMGTIGSTIDTLTTGSGSMIQAELDGFTNRSQQMTTQLAAMQVRTAAYQTLLQAQFTQMNATMMQYKQIGASLTADSNASSNTNGTL